MEEGSSASLFLSLSLFFLSLGVQPFSNSSTAEHSLISGGASTAEQTERARERSRQTERERELERQRHMRRERELPAVVHSTVFAPPLPFEMQHVCRCTAHSSQACALLLPLLQLLLLLLLQCCACFSTSLRSVQRGAFELQCG